MYLHLGNNIIVQDRDIVGIFDIDNTTVSKHTRKYLAQRTKNAEIVTVSQELPKSFIVCQHGGKRTVYISQLSSKTLLNRGRDAVPAPLSGALPLNPTNF